MQGIFWCANYNTMKAVTWCLLALLAYLSGAYSLDHGTGISGAGKLRHYIVYKPATGDVSVNADGSSSRTVESEMAQMVNRARFGNFSTSDAAEQPPVEFTYVFQYALRGCALKLTEAEAATLSSFPGVNVVPDGTSMPLTTHTPEFLGLATGKLWPKSKQGGDVIIGLLDTGIWPESHSFSDVGFGPVPKRWKGVCEEGTRFTKANCNRKLIGARFYYKGHEAGEGIDLTENLLSPRDTGGHGSHTASTAAGSATKVDGFGTARGMAPAARVAMYKVCWRACYNSDMLAGFDQAVRDGVDVLSVSIGGLPQPLVDEVNSVATFGAMKAGIFVALAAGNDGGDRATVVNVAPWAMTVAASSVDREFFVNVALGSGVKLRGASWTTGPKVARPLILATKAARKFVPALMAANCMEGTLDPALTKGKMVVCRHDGYNTRVEKGIEVLASGGAGLVILDFAGTPTPIHHVLPAVHVGKAAADVITRYLNTARNPTATLSPGTVTGIKPAPSMASFSSRGPSLYQPQVLKPDITAPGLYILAAWQGHTAPSLVAGDPRRIKYNVISGTSMATPHIAGLAALLRGAHPTWSPAMIKSALMTTASVTDNRTPRRPIADLFTGGAATPFAMGAGHVGPERALNPGLVYDLKPRDYINYLCALGFPPAKVQLFTGEPVTCLPSRVEDFNYPSFSGTFRTGSAGPFAVTFTRTLSNVGAPLVTYHAVVKAPAGVQVVVTPAKLVFKPGTKSLKFSVRVTMARAREAFASLTWTAGTVQVRSPIVIAAV